GILSREEQNERARRCAPTPPHTLPPGFPACLVLFFTGHASELASYSIRKPAPFRVRIFRTRTGQGSDHGFRRRTASTPKAVGGGVVARRLRRTASPGGRPVEPPPRWPDPHANCPGPRGLPAPGRQPGPGLGRPASLLRCGSPGHARDPHRP